MMKSVVQAIRDRPKTVHGNLLFDHAEPEVQDTVWATTFLSVWTIMSRYVWEPVSRSVAPTSVDWWTRVLK